MSSEKSGKNSKGQFVKGNKLGTGRPKHITTIIREMSNDYKDYLVMLDGWARQDMYDDITDKKDAVGIEAARQARLVSDAFQKVVDGRIKKQMRPGGLLKGKKEEE